MEGVSFCDEELSVGRGDGYFCLDTRFFRLGVAAWISTVRFMDGWMDGCMGLQKMVTPPSQDLN